MTAGSFHYTCAGEHIIIVGASRLRLMLSELAYGNALTEQASLVFCSSSNHGLYSRDLAKDLHIFYKIVATKVVSNSLILLHHSSICTR